MRYAQRERVDQSVLIGLRNAILPSLALWALIIGGAWYLFG